MDTLVLDKNKLIRKGLIHFLNEEDILRVRWESSIGTDNEKIYFQEFMVKKKLILDMMSGMLRHF